jgi:hypothetical protein
MRHPAESDARFRLPWGRVLPSWLASFVLHALLLLALGLSMNFAPRLLGIAGGSSTDLPGQLLLTQHREGGGFYEDGDGGEGEGQGEGVSLTVSPVSAADVLGGIPGGSPGTKLPAGDRGGLTSFGNGGGGGTGSGSGGGGSGGLIGNPGQPRTGYGKSATTSFYGVRSQGNSFVFVIDRSASMEHAKRLESAKAELLAALSCLNEVNQFQIIFFNNDLDYFRPRGNRAFHADAATKQLAERYIRGIMPDGPTEAFHRALRAALQYNPDVIYFLTDAEDIGLSSAELGILRQSNKGASIHVIKFGEGAEERIPWLVKLTEQNSGEYRYVDVRALRGR